jgi:hypothetical protein
MGRLPRVTVMTSPRSIASSSSEKLRDAAVAVMVRMAAVYQII